LSNREPWLAVNLSEILPGLGQIYSGNQSRGYIILSLNILLFILSLWLILGISGNILLGLTCLLSQFILFIWNLFDAYHCAKSKNSPEFERLRKQSKDPWLATFLSNIFLGIGYFYIGKWLLGILAIILIIICANISLFLLPIVYAVISYLTYVFSPVHRENSRNMALIVAILIAISGLLNAGWIIRTYGVEARWIPSGAMEPTLHGTPNQWEADRVLVDKLSYRFQAPKRGDIIVFSPTDELLKQQYQDAFIKRIVGLPGEKVELKGGQVYINNQALVENYLTANQRTLIDVCISAQLQPPYLAKPVTIPPESYLVLGDNRSSSYDSRCWGVVPRNLIIGKAYKKFSFVNESGLLTESRI
jgi:signal peptidase I